MKRIRLDIGALTASPNDGGSFMFFLYREGMDRCLPVKLSPPDMHAVLANFNTPAPPGGTIHNLMHATLQEFKIELLEVTVIREEEDKEFATQLLFFDGEREVTRNAGFIDGVILAKTFACPIYIEEDTMEKYASTILPSASPSAWPGYTATNKTPPLSSSSTAASMAGMVVSRIVVTLLSLPGR